MNTVFFLLVFTPLGLVFADTTLDSFTLDLRKTTSAINLVRVTPTGTTGPAVNQVCKSTPADLVFLLDISSSEGSTNFNKQLEFVSKIVDHFEIGPNAVQVGVVTSSTTVENQFWLNEHGNKNELQSAIKAIRYPSGNTLTQLGLEFVRTQAFLPEHGARNNSAKILIVLTDGQTTQKQHTVDVANLIHNTDIKVISIGIGSQVDTTELKTIATDNQHFFAVANFAALQNIERDVLQTTCKSEQLACRSSPADIVFLLDSSSSEGQNNFKKQLEFVNNFVKDFEIGPQAVQIGIVTFASNPKNQIWLNDFSNKTKLMAAVLKIPYSSGNTQTDDALRFVRLNSFDPTHGARNNSNHVLIVLTDGHSTEPAETVKEANAIHKEGFNVISIGIGSRVDTSELLAIATDPQSMFAIANFDILKTIEKGIQQVTCNSCKSKPSDIVFLLDTSSSEGPTNFQKQLDFVNNFAREFNIGPDSVQISVVTFSTSVKNEFWLNQYADKIALLDAIQKIPYRSGNTQTDDGLKFVRQNSFDPSHGGRKDSQQVLIVLTDGHSTQITETAREATLMHTSGVKVIAVGIGSSISQNELKTIASDINNVFTVANFDALETIEKGIRQTTCSGPQSPCKAVQADIIFVLDSSAKFGSVNFQKQVTFAHNFIDQLDIGPNAVQFGIVTISPDVQNQVWLNSYSSKPALLAAVDRIPSSSGATQTVGGLQFVYQTALSTAHGKRSNAQAVVIVLSDGHSTKTAENIHEADLLRRSGTKVITVGIGNGVTNKDLEKIATVPQYVFSVTNFGDLGTIQSKLQSKTCESVQLVCRSSEADIVFVVDSSTSEGRTNFAKQLDFVKNFIRAFDVGPSAVQFGMVTFDSNIHNRFYLNAYSSKPALLDAVTKVPYTGGDTHTGAALDFVRQRTLSTQHGSRLGAAKIVVVLTDGNSQDTRGTQREATLLHNTGTEVISIGIGSGIRRSELNNIASDKQHVFFVPNFDALHTIQKELQQTTCNIQAITLPGSRPTAARHSG